PLLVDVRAVQRARIAQHVTVGVAFNGHVTPRHGDVVEEDVGVGVPADRGGRLRQPERRAGVGAGAHAKQAYAGREAVEVLPELVLLIGRLDRRQRERVLAGRTGERGAARRTEPGVLRIVVTAAGAEHDRPGYRRST